MAKHLDLGNQGENLAIDYLINRGFTILERNYRFQKAEVDIIVQKESLLIAVEVKTRATKAFGNPQDFLKPNQIQRIVKAMDHYITSQHLDVELRFDIIAVVKEGSKTEIEHLENAFYHF